MCYHKRVRMVMAMNYIDGVVNKEIVEDVLLKSDGVDCEIQKIKIELGKY